MKRAEGTDPREEIRLLLKVLDSAPGLLAYWDNHQRCRFANAAYEVWFGVKPQDLVGKTMKDLLGPIYPINLPFIEGALRGEPQSFDREIPDPAGGPPRYSQANYIPDVANGVVRGFVVMVSEITERRRLENRLRAAEERAFNLASHDFLTGLPNRVLLEDRISRAIEDAKRHRRKCAVVFLDLDGFKNVNDTFGHAAGDHLLCEVARRMAGTLRRSDTVARLGGDEFLILIPEVDRNDQVQLVAEKLLHCLSEPIRFQDDLLPIGASAGIAVFPDTGSDVDQLMTRSDAALHEAKQSGKNQFKFFSSPDESPR